MATALATTAAPVQFDFQNNNVEVMTLDTLRRTHKENDIYGNPLKGIYHYEVIERMADICQKHNLNYEVEEIFAAQNKNKAQPGVVVPAPGGTKVRGDGRRGAYPAPRLYDHPH